MSALNDQKVDQPEDVAGQISVFNKRIDIKTQILRNAH